MNSAPGSPAAAEEASEQPAEADLAAPPRTRRERRAAEQRTVSRSTLPPPLELPSLTGSLPVVPPPAEDAHATPVTPLAAVEAPEPAPEPAPAPAPEPAPDPETDPAPRPETYGTPVSSGRRAEDRALALRAAAGLAFLAAWTALIVVKHAL